MSLRVVHAVCSDSFAGVERYVQRIAIAQAEDGHDVTVLGGAPAQMTDPLSAAGVAFAPMPGFLSGVRTLRAHAGADVVNTHMTASDVAAVAAGVGRRSALIATRHFAQPRGRVGPVPIDRLVSHRIDAEIAISRAVADGMGVPGTVVHTGVPLADPAPVRSARTILMAQRLQPEKHSWLGVRAFAASGLAAHGWRLVIAGEGPERGELIRLGEELGVSGAMDLLGFREDVPALLHESALVIAPCPREGLGLTVLEAMSHAVPVVAAAAAGHLDLIGDADQRLLFPPDDVQGAAGRMRALAEDAELRAQLGAALQERQRIGFTVDAQARNTERVYRQALGRRRRWTS